MSVNREMAELAGHLARYAARTTGKEQAALNLSFFMAKVTAKPAGGTSLSVQRPFDNTVLTLPCVGSAYAALSVGDSCFVLVPGSVSNAIVLGTGNLSNL